MTTSTKQTFHLLTPRDPPRLLSLVIPVYNEEEVLGALAERIRTTLPQLPCAAEVILVNDGSSDHSLDKLREFAAQDPRFRVICLARNFGHQIAATAGLDAAQGDAVVLMDADLQDPPELVLEMLQQYAQGYDVVYARRLSRQGEGWPKRWSAWLFYRVMRLLVDPNLPPDTGDFRLVSRRCLDALKEMREVHRFLRGMITWVGFPQTAVTFNRPARAAGSTKYPLRKSLRFAWAAAVSFSPAPVRMVFFLGSSVFAVGLAYAAYSLVYKYFFGGTFVRGWTSLVVLICLTGGSTMMSIGIVGEYVARIFEEIKRRPLYIVSDRWNFERDARMAQGAKK